MPRALLDHGIEVGVSHPLDWHSAFFVQRPGQFVRSQAEQLQQSIAFDAFHRVDRITVRRKLPCGHPGTLTNSARPLCCPKQGSMSSTGAASFVPFGVSAQCRCARGTGARNRLFGKGIRSQRGKGSEPAGVEDFRWDVCRRAEQSGHSAGSVADRAVKKRVERLFQEVSSNHEQPDVVDELAPPSRNTLSARGPQTSQTAAAGRPSASGCLAGPSTSR